VDCSSSSPALAARFLPTAFFVVAVTPPLPSPSILPPAFSIFLKPLVSETFRLFTEALPKSAAAFSQLIYRCQRYQDLRGRIGGRLRCHPGDG
jgi:hypothetical protein